MQRPIPDFPGFHAHDDGSITDPKGRVLTTRPANKGVLIADLRIPNGKSTTKTVHRLVCIAFHGAPPCGDCEVHHKDKDRNNNRPDNLEWKTMAEHHALHRHPIRSVQKPRPDFPLTPAGNGQWVKKVKQVKYYFGSWKDDPKGEAALKDWLARKDAIHAGLDSLRVTTAQAGMVLGELMGKYLEQFRTQATSNERSLATLGDYIRELQAFVNASGPNAPVANLKPEHFAKYHKLLVEGGRPLPSGEKGGKLGRHARRRVIRYIRAMLNWGAGNGWYPKPTFGNEFKAPDTRPDAMRQAKAREGKKDYSARLVTGAELDTLVEKATPLFKALILMGVNCGLGPADLGRLRWSHIDMESGKLDMPRGKTGTERVGYMWKRTREALRRVSTLKHNRTALELYGQDAFVFLTRKGLPVYREWEASPGVVRVANAISITFGRLARGQGLKGVTFYRFRHTFKTLGKRAKDRDTLNLMMGHKENSTGETYDHEDISFKRVKRVAVKVKQALWVSKEGKRKPMMRLVGVA